MLRQNPLIPKAVPIHGLMFDPASGALQVLVDGYTKLAAGQTLPPHVGRL